MCISGCTTQESIYEDNANRSFLLYLDESGQQDEKVMHYQRLLSAGKINSYEEKQVKLKMQNVQSILQPIAVRNPYAEYLQIPKEVFKPRRTNAHYIAFIEAVTFYKQYQRPHKTDEATGEKYIESTLEDIEEANALMKEILLRKSDELSGACRTYFENLKKYLKSNGQKQFSNKEIRTVLKENQSNQKRWMLELKNYGYIRKSEGDQKKGFLYEVSSYEEYEELQGRIATVLDEILEGLRAVQQSKAVQTKNEPLNKLTVNKKTAKVQAVSENKETA